MMADPALVSLFFVVALVANAALYALAVPLRKPRHAEARIIDLAAHRRARRH